MAQHERPPRNVPAAIEQNGPLIFHTATEIIVTGGSDEQQHELALIQFWRDGSIFVQPRHFDAPEGGVVAVVPWRPAESPPFTFRIADYGKHASALLKLSHKPDGRVHFSQDGQGYTRVIRRGFPLRTAIGRVFSIEAYGLEGFPPFRGTKKTRAYFHFRAGATIPPRIRVFGEWVRKLDVIRGIGYGETHGPQARARRLPGTGTVPVLYVGQPDGFPLRDHILMIGAELRSDVHTVTEKVNRSTIVIFGGWDHEEFAPGQARAVRGEALAGLYPYTPGTDDDVALESIDFSAGNASA